MSEELLALLLLLVSSAVTSFLATIAVRHVAERIGALDHPGERRAHEKVTARLGGLAIIFGFGFPLLLLAGNSHAAALASKNISYLCAVLAAGAVVVGLGVYDDVVGADAPKKFAAQIAAAIILVSFGFHFGSISIAGYNFNLGIIGSLASIVWIVGVINAMNFIDGIDSLATVVALTIAVAFAVIAFLRRDAFSLVMMTALAGSLIGFYPWNRPPARIFMGDTGSLFIGLLLAAISIARPSKSPVALIIGGPMLALAVPVIDTLIVMKQRFDGPSTPVLKRIGRMFNADRLHIHHILIERFGSIGKTIVSIWLVTVVFAASAIMTVVDSLKPYGYGIGIVGLVAMFFLRYTSRRELPSPPRTGEKVPQADEGASIASGTAPHPPAAPSPRAEGRGKKL
jgi:UDP-GlcNAc:undecaprenyl-phosphate GlcNAc-1-phosphate transferase